MEEHNATTFMMWVPHGEALALPETIKLNNKLLTLGIKVVFITEGPLNLKYVTVSNLQRVGPYERDKLIVKNPSTNYQMLFNLLREGSRRKRRSITSTGDSSGGEHRRRRRLVPRLMAPISVDSMSGLAVLPTATLAAVDDVGDTYLAICGGWPCRWWHVVVGRRWLILPVAEDAHPWDRRLSCTRGKGFYPIAGSSSDDAGRHRQRRGWQSATVWVETGT